MKLIDKLKFPDDINSLDFAKLDELSQEIREFLIESVSKTGGHLSSNLGVCDLTLSLFKAFDFNKDKVIFDVGHQSYVYKILTGRKDDFVNLRKYGGLSGFPKTNESKFDFFNTGHSSTSISAGLGMARARDIKGEKYNIISVIGDGALTGGMSFEALNDLGFRKTKMIVILNDNGMSIAKNVGGLSKYLNYLRIKPSYSRLKNNIHASLETTDFGKNVADRISKLKDRVKKIVIPSMLFEDMGLKYIGPIDGHNIKEMTEIFKNVKEIDEPCIIHVVTKKGRGYQFAEESPGKFHGIKPFDLESGEVKKSLNRTFSKAFGKSIIDIAKKNKKVVAVTAAMPDGTGLKEFSQIFKNRFFDVGIAEQHAVTLSAGMAISGLVPVAAIYSTFLQRAYDQILHDVCLQNLHVVFAIDRAGIVGEDGETHQGIMDVSFLYSMPNMTIIEPKCTDEVKNALNYAVNEFKGPIVVRYPKGGDSVLDLKPIKKFDYGKWEVINEGEDVCIIASGRMLQNALIAKDSIENEKVNPMIVNASFIKPIDTMLLDKIAKKNFNILILEDNMISGGLGTNIVQYINSNGNNNKIVLRGYNDFVPQGNVNILYKIYGLDCDSIKQDIINLYKNKRRV
ncbi:1-deoxy-D-xylulose-5-phosphate synthase [Clostridium sp. BJN0001]|uniref:1-deoxy-D-xylulose-5-phosphate synthase n=1 Tax=Clostridium sp. BJN0001 TaxID=2930219 RepID=UPI001FD43CD2|nr:1-deoxy-D-xylulose-5-phosphate synthase [Clostridium sp. BJN0001]